MNLTEADLGPIIARGGELRIYREGIGSAAIIIVRVTAFNDQNKECGIEAPVDHEAKDGIGTHMEEAIEKLVTRLIDSMSITKVEVT